tara:strand:- start:255 stop:1259 length:1005 start_codon:yes stop_codon:yes gene_type:complete
VADNNGPIFFGFRTSTKKTSLRFEKKPQSIMSIHSGITCDASGQSPIIGARYTHMCKDFDLCPAEFDKLSSTDKSMFVKIMEPLAARVVEFEYKDKDWHAITHKSLIRKMQTLVDKTATEVKYSHYREQYTARLVHADDHEILRTNVNTGKTRKVRMPALHIGTLNSEDKETSRTVAAEDRDEEEAAATEPEDEQDAVAEAKHNDGSSGEPNNVLNNPPKQEVKSMSIKVLKSTALSLDLPNYGTKGDIIGRIRSHVNGNDVLAKLLGGDLSPSVHASTVTQAPIVIPPLVGAHVPSQLSSVDPIEWLVKKIKAAEQLGDAQMVQRLKRKLEDC